MAINSKSYNVRSEELSAQQKKLKLLQQHQKAMGDVVEHARLLVTERRRALSTLDAAKPKAK